jgi:hypothetical protein
LKAKQSQPPPQTDAPQWQVFRAVVIPRESGLVKRRATASLAASHCSVPFVKALKPKDAQQLKMVFGDSSK